MRQPFCILVLVGDLLDGGELEGAVLRDELEVEPRPRGRVGGRLEGGLFPDGF